MDVAVAGIVIQNGKVLIGKKIHKPGHFVSDGWHIPGGHLLNDEEITTAIIREIKEETNLDIVVIEKLTSHIVTETDTEIHWFICEATTFDLIAMDDLTEVKFIPKSEVLSKCDLRAINLWPDEVIKYLGE